MGGLEHARFIEFNWRGWPTSNPEEPQPSAMPFHPDTDGNTEDILVFMRMLQRGSPEVKRFLTDIPLLNTADTRTWAHGVLFHHQLGMNEHDIS